MLKVCTVCRGVKKIMGMGCLDVDCYGCAGLGVVVDKAEKKEPPKANFTDEELSEADKLAESAMTEIKAKRKARRA